LGQEEELKEMQRNWGHRGNKEAEPKPGGSKKEKGGRSLFLTFARSIKRRYGFTAREEKKVSPYPTTELPSSSVKRYLTARQSGRERPGALPSGQRNDETRELWTTEKGCKGTQATS